MRVQQCYVEKIRSIVQILLYKLELKKMELESKCMETEAEMKSRCMELEGKAGKCRTINER